MLKSCKYCGKLHQYGDTCPQKPKREDRTEPTYIDKFRASGAWRKKREAIKERDLYLCQSCLHKLVDIGQRQYNSDKLQVHHIVPIADAWDKRLSDENLITLCPFCHSLAEHGDIPAEMLAAIVSEKSQ